MLIIAQFTLLAVSRGPYPVFKLANSHSSLLICAGATEDLMLSLGHLKCTLHIRRGVLNSRIVTHLIRSLFGAASQIFSTIASTASAILPLMFRTFHHRSGVRETLNGLQSIMWATEVASTSCRMVQMMMVDDAWWAEVASGRSVEVLTVYYSLIDRFTR